MKKIKKIENKEAVAGLCVLVMVFLVLIGSLITGIKMLMEMA